VKMSELRKEQPAPEPPSPSQIVHAPRGSAPRSVRRQAAKAAQQGHTRRTRKAQARILRAFGASDMPITGASKAQQRIAHGS
jgi:hypothetical protein